jgi:hypothetical protein
VAQLGESLAFDLADALPGEVQGVTDLFEGARVAPVEPVAEAKDLALPGVQGLEQLFDLFAEEPSGDDLERRCGTEVGHDVTEVSVAIGTNGGRG